MKSPYMRTIIGSSGNDCFNYLQLYGFKGGFSGGNLFWTGQYDPHIGRRTNPVLI